MNFAEGKGPKNVKRKWPLGQFVTIYGNGNPANVYSPGVAYPPAISGTIPTWNVNTNSVGGVTGSLSPGLNLNLNGNGAIDVGAVCAPSPNMSLQDIETVYVDFWINATFSGTVYLRLQGSNDRLTGATDYNSTNWITLLSGTVASNNTGTTFTLNNIAGAVEFPKIAYRVTASGTTTTNGIIDWVIPSMFLDLNAMGTGTNIIDTNGNIGQMSIQTPRNIAISGGAITSVTGTNTPYENLKTNHTWVG